MRETPLDKIAWETIHSIPGVPLSRSAGVRSRNYRELEEKLQAGIPFEHAWSDFLHALYTHRDASFFEYPSPPSLSVAWQAVLAGAAEWLSQEFDLPHPAWTDDPKYFLDKPWHPIEDFGVDAAEEIIEELPEAPEAFRKRNLAFLSRNLIAL
jgi:hypothetical protein